MIRPGVAGRIEPGLLLLCYGIAALLTLLVASWGAPLLDAFSFRQTQTAMSAYWLIKGAPGLSYETPLLGYPWSIPFEFPLYQWLVAKATVLFGLSIDHSGRLLSCAFLLGSAYLVYRAVWEAVQERGLALLCAGALMASPLAVFWGRAVLIESTALFFSLAFVWGLASFNRERSVLAAATAILGAVIAALVKITTFYCFAVFACGALVLLLAENLRWSSIRQHAGILVVAGASATAAFVALKLWLHHADALKAQTIWGISLSSTYLAPWNYGTLEQRMSAELWQGVMLQRGLREGIGSVTLAVASLLVVLVDRRFRRVGALLLGSYIIPFLTFTNLHLIHNYYQYANFAFPSMLVALAIWIVSKKFDSRPAVGFALAAMLCAISWYQISSKFMPLIRQDHYYSQTMQLVRYLRTNTSSEDALLVFGLNWAPDVPYYAERRAMMLPDWVPPEDFLSTLNQKEAFGDVKVGAVVVCPNELDRDPERSRIYRALLEQYTRGRTMDVIAGCKVFR